MKRTKAAALCGVSAALAVTVMLLGEVTGIGLYIAPMLSGLILTPVGMTAGRRYHLCAFAVTAALCFIIVAEPEQNLMFACYLGWYPIARPGLDKIKKPARQIVKLLLFNGIIIGVEALVMRVLAPETESTPVLAALLVLANITNVLYDRLVPRIEYRLYALVSRIK